MTEEDYANYGIGLVDKHEIDALAIKKRLGREWNPPYGYGQDCWVFDNHYKKLRIIVSAWIEPDGMKWIHASISYATVDKMPGYNDLKLLHQAIFVDGYSYQCFVPTKDHINIRENVLHLWGRFDGKMALPDFGRMGSI